MHLQTSSADRYLHISNKVVNTAQLTNVLSSIANPTNDYVDSFIGDMQLSEQVSKTLLGNLPKGL